MRQPLRQWVLKITAYADRLADDLEACGVEWPEGTKTAQENWIGRSEGALTPLTLTPTITLTPTPALTLTLTLTRHRRQRRVALRAVDAAAGGRLGRQGVLPDGP